MRRLEPSDSLGASLPPQRRSIILSTAIIATSCYCRTAVCEQFQNRTASPQTAPTRIMADLFELSVSDFSPVTSCNYVIFSRISEHLHLHGSSHSWRVVSKLRLVCRSFRELLWKCSLPVFVMTNDGNFPPAKAVRIGLVHWRTGALGNCRARYRSQ
jgi:hypothetical protein